MIIRIDRETRNPALAKNIGGGRVLIERPAQQRAAFQIGNLVNAQSGKTVDREIRLAAADQQGVPRRIRWIELKGADSLRIRGIHQSCPRSAAVACLIDTTLRCANIGSVRIGGIYCHRC